MDKIYELKIVFLINHNVYDLQCFCQWFNMTVVICFKDTLKQKISNLTFIIKVIENILVFVLLKSQQLWDELYTCTGFLLFFSFFFHFHCFATMSKKSRLYIKWSFSWKNYKHWYFLITNMLPPLYTTKNKYMFHYGLFITISTKCQNSRILFRSLVKYAHNSLIKAIYHVRNFSVCC